MRVETVHCVILLRMLCGQTASSSTNDTITKKVAGLFAGFLRASGLAADLCDPRRFLRRGYGLVCTPASLNARRQPRCDTNVPTRRSGSGPTFIRPATTSPPGWRAYQSAVAPNRPSTA